MLSASHQNADHGLRQRDNEFRLDNRRTRNCRFIRGICSGLAGGAVAASLTQSRAGWGEQEMSHFFIFSPASRMSRAALRRLWFS
jgi:hypothetical protein